MQNGYPGVTQSELNAVVRELKEELRAEMKESIKREIENEIINIKLKFLQCVIVIMHLFGLGLIVAMSLKLI